jgi:predicted house-cleaning noncanonical NTP pyrophosphatase (MazG superfamily)
MVFKILKKAIKWVNNKIAERKYLHYLDDEKYIKKLANAIEIEIKNYLNSRDLSKLHHYERFEKVFGIEAIFAENNFRIQLVYNKQVISKGIFIDDENIAKSLYGGDKNLIEEIAQLMIKRGLVENYHELKLAYSIKEAIENYKKRNLYVADIIKQTLENRQYNTEEEGYFCFLVEPLPNNFKITITFDKSNDIDDIKAGFVTDPVTVKNFYECRDGLICGLAIDQLEPNRFKNFWITYHEMIQMARVDNPELEQWVKYP